MLNAITVIAQYARDQAVASARDQALHVAKLDRARVSPRRMDHGEHIPGTEVFQDFAIFNRKPSSVVHACVLSNMRLIAYLGRHGR